MNPKHSSWRALACVGCLAVSSIASGSGVAQPDTAASAAPANTLPRFEDSTDLKDLPARWAPLMEEFLVPGLAVAVIKDGKLHAVYTAGTRDAAMKKPVTPQTMFYIASITKSYLATAICVLADQGKLSLDDPVKKHLPRFALADAQAAERITIRDLLSHTPGINSTPIVTLDAYTGEITEDRYYHWLAEARPSGNVTYTNVHYTILGRVVESVTGKPWKDALEELVLKPAGLARTTGYASRAYADADHADPMEWAGSWKQCELVKTDAVMHAAGGMCASLHDAVGFLSMHLNQGEINGKRILSPEKTALMRTQQSTLPKPNGSIRILTGFGLAWQVGTFAGKPFMQHGGGYSGAMAYYGMLPEQRAGFVIMMNASETARGMGDIIAIDLLNRLTGENLAPNLLDTFLTQARNYRKSRAEKIAQETSGHLGEGALSVDPATLIGEYRHPWWGTVRLRKSPFGLTLAIGTVDVRVESTGTDSFNIKGPIFESTKGRILPGEGTNPARIIFSDPDVGDVTYERASP